MLLPLLALRPPPEAMASLLVGLLTTVPRRARLDLPEMLPVVMELLRLRRPQMLGVDLLALLHDPDQAVQAARTLFRTQAQRQLQALAQAGALALLQSWAIWLA